MAEEATQRRERPAAPHAQYDGARKQAGAEVCSGDRRRLTDVRMMQSHRRVDHGQAR
jgi:hypothetical protein